MEALNDLKKKLGGEEGFANFAFTYATRDELVAALDSKYNIKDETSIDVVVGAVKRAGGLKNDVPKPVSERKRRLEDSDSFYQSRQKVSPISRLSKNIFQIKLDGTDSSLLFFLEHHREKIELWLEHLNRPVHTTQLKSLLMIDGAVKSGKTTLATKVLPFFLREINPNDDFCFASVDLIGLAGLGSPELKWAEIYRLLGTIFKDTWFVPQDVLQHLQADGSHLKVKVALQNLAKVQPGTRWYVVLDEYHFLYNSLVGKQMENVAEQIKLVLLDNESPVHFILTGSTQSTFWVSITKSRADGLNMLTGSVVLTTDYKSMKKKILTIMILSIKNSVNGNPYYPRSNFHRLPKDILFIIFQFLTLEETRFG